MPAVSRECDVLVVGGGINGAGIARDAAGRGLSVVLCEQHDLASHTSSASTKLIHGGLRYLEHYEFRLVRKALVEREVLLRGAAHIMRPLEFILPHDAGQRPAWMIRAGMFLYDHLARRAILPGSAMVDLRTHVAGAPLKESFVRGFRYADGWVDDARLVVLAALDAAERGARVLTRTTVTQVRQEGDAWRVVLRDADGGANEVRARSLVNATGPWASRFLEGPAQQPAISHVRLIKGSHIVVRKRFDHPYAYLFQHPDGRIVFAIPYEGEFTLIGTTDLDYTGEPGTLAITPEEVDYLCELASRYFRAPLSAADVVWSYAGVRPLVEDEHADAKSVTRDYRLEFDHEAPPLLSVFGGKITTFRKLAEEALDMLAPRLGCMQPPWTARACLPGGEIAGALPSNEAVQGFDAWASALADEFAFLPRALVHRYARAYGARTRRMLADCSSIEDMGERLAEGLYAAEVAYLMDVEWARSAEDVLWRRSKLGLHLPAEVAPRLDAWMAARRQQA